MQPTVEGASKQPLQCPPSKAAATKEGDTAPLLKGAAVDGELRPVDLLEVLAHLTHCPPPCCRQATDGPGRSIRVAHLAEGAAVCCVRTTQAGGLQP